MPPKKIVLHLSLFGIELFASGLWLVSEVRPVDRFDTLFFRIVWSPDFTRLLLFGSSRLNSLIAIECSSKLFSPLKRNLLRVPLITWLLLFIILPHSFSGLISCFSALLFADGNFGKLVEQGYFAPAVTGGGRLSLWVGSELREFGGSNLLLLFGWFLLLLFSASASSSVSKICLVDGSLGERGDCELKINEIAFRLTASCKLVVSLTVP